MKVSKLLMWCLAVFAALSFAFTPVVADSPWNEEEGGGEGETPGSGNLTPEDPNVGDPDNPETLYGTTLWWLELIWDGLSEEGGNNAAVPATTPGTDSETDSSQLEGSLR